MIRFVTGDLLAAEVEALVNPVNTVGVMGKGLALQFKRAFPENFRAYAAACRRGQLETGRMFVFETGAPGARFIINFPTKQHWRSPSRLEYVVDGLVDLVRVVAERPIRSLAIPPLGAGLGGLAWGEVRALVDAALRPLAGVDALVFEPTEPAGRPRAR